MISIKNVSKIYSKNKFKAVDDLSLDIKEGEIFGFIGPNGAGKSTTIKMLTGILPFEFGSITLNDVDINFQPVEAKKLIGFVPDNHAVYDKLSGKEYINFIADIYKVNKADREERSNRLLKMFQLEDSFNNPIKSYSHGMKQKIVIIASLIHNPKIWILDEPLTGLDPQSAFALKEEMKKRAEMGCIVFFSTHVLEVAQKLCTRVGIINKGKIIKVATMDEITNQAGEDLEKYFLDLVNPSVQNKEVAENV